MAQFEALNDAIAGLDGAIDDLVTRLEGASVEDPETQAKIDEAVTRITEVRGRIDAIAGGGAEPATPEVSQPIADTGPQVEHR